MNLNLYPACQDAYKFWKSSLMSVLPWLKLIAWAKEVGRQIKMVDILKKYPLDEEAFRLYRGSLGLQSVPWDQFMVLASIILKRQISKGDLLEVVKFDEVSVEQDHCRDCSKKFRPVIYRIFHSDGSPITNSKSEEVNGGNFIPSIIEISGKNVFFPKLLCGDCMLIAQRNSNGAPLHGKPYSFCRRICEEKNILLRQKESKKRREIMEGRCIPGLVSQAFCGAPLSIQ